MHKIVVAFNSLDYYSTLKGYFIYRVPINTRLQGTLNVLEKNNYA